MSLRRFFQRLSGNKSTEALGNETDRKEWLRKKYYDYWNYNDFENEDVDLIFSVLDYTMTSPERMSALLTTIEHIVENDISGDIIECGVWRGGSMMLIAKKLVAIGLTDRNLYLYDTFEGMTKPDRIDVSYDNTPAINTYNETYISEETSSWCMSSFEEVYENMLSTGYPKEKIFLVKGKVEDTLQPDKHKSISLLRLDTDWYSSTLHELNCLYDKISTSGILLIDDYGHWKGARKAVDDYFLMKQIRKPFLHRVDYSCRLIIK